MQQIKPGIYFEDQHLGVTLGALVYSHGTVLIDAPLRPEDARSWRSGLLSQRGGIGRLLVLLDAHPDRSLGARSLESTILVHQETAEKFNDRSIIFKGQVEESGAIWETYHEAIGTRWALPDITFSDQMTLHWGGPEILLEHHPGPAPGATWVLIPEEKVLFIGDTVITDSPPFLANSDLEKWIDTLQLLNKSYKDYTIIGGRNGIITIEDVRAQIRFLKKVIFRFDKLAEKNAPPDETEIFLSTLLSSFEIPAEKYTRCAQRLKNGLSQCYNNHYFQPQNSEGDLNKYSPY
jgi:glyoxylase-like metal-dependent hydrolase (beta-lactamase superfamily II)